MAGHRVYKSVVEAVKAHKIKEPFMASDFRKACHGFAEVTYNVFLNKNRVGNPGGNSELFVKVSPGTFKLLRPFKYGF